MAYFRISLQTLWPCGADSEQSTKASAPAHAASTKPKTQNGSMGPPKAAPKAPPPVEPDNSTSKVPEGFFDNVDADHRARGLEPPKIDIKWVFPLFRSDGFSFIH